MEVCRICLATDRKMQLFDKKRVLLYELITGLTFEYDDLMPKYVCWECAYYMSKYVTFKNRAKSSYRTLTEILNEDGIITKSSVENCNQYKSALAITDTLNIFLKNEDNNMESEMEIKDKSNDNIIDSIFEITDDSDNNFEDVSLSNNDTLLTDIIVSSPAKLPCVKRKRKDTESENSNVKKNSNDINKKPNKTIKLVRVRRKQTSAVKKNKCGNPRKTIRDEIDTSILRLTELTLDEQIADLQDRKESSNYRNSPYKCENCFRGFLDVSAFNLHMVKHSESSGANVCPVCKTRYRLPSELKTHTDLHLYRVSCLKCNFTTKLLGAAKMHQHSHQGVKYNCPHCNEVYNHKTTFLNHLRIKHPSDIICKRCGCSFVNENGLKKHERMVHRADQGQIPADGPVCARCDIRFSCQEALERHRQVSDKHADERTAGIVKPGRNTFPVTIERNKRPKSGPAWTSDPFPDGPRACEQCEEKLPNPRAYYNHFSKAHKDKNRTFFYNKSEERHMCEVCGKLFQSANHLRSHSYAHSSTKQFKCDRCGKLFQLEIHLYNHQRHHCGTRVDYPCRVCGKVFASVSNRGRHMAVHKGLKYKCELCDKVFNCPSNKKAHVDFVHKKKPWPKRNRGPRRRPERQPEAVVQNPSYETEADVHEEWNTP